MLYFYKPPRSKLGPRIMGCVLGWGGESFEDDWTLFTRSQLKATETDAPPWPTGRWATTRSQFGKDRRGPIWPGPRYRTRGATAGVTHESRPGRYAVDELEELNRRCIAAVAGEVDRGGDDLLERDEEWVPTMISRVLEDDQELVARTVHVCMEALVSEKRSDDPDVRALLGMYRAGRYDEMGVQDVVADVILNRKGGVMDAIHDLRWPGDWEDPTGF